MEQPDPVHTGANWNLGKIAMLKNPGVNNFHEIAVFCALVARLNVTVKRPGNPLANNKS